MATIVAIIINKPVSNSPETWEMEVDPHLKQFDTFWRDGVLYEIRQVLPREIVEQGNGNYDVMPKIYHSFPMPV